MYFEQKLLFAFKGEKVMDNESLKLFQILMSGEVPSSWSGTKYKKTVAQYLDIIKIRFKFYQVSFKYHSCSLKFHMIF